MRLPYVLTLVALLAPWGCADADQASSRPIEATLATGEATGEDASAADTEADSSSSGYAQGDGSGSSEGSSTQGDSGTCIGTTQTIVLTAPAVMLIVDKSLSMTNLWDHDGDAQTPLESRWQSLHRVIEYLVVGLEDRVEFGLQLLPAADAMLDEPINASSCSVNEIPEVVPGTGHSQSILDAMPAPDDDISGATPTRAAFLRAAQQLDDDVADHRAKAVVLVTDGAANCTPDATADETLYVYDDGLPALLDEARLQHGIITYVVGIDILDALGTKPAINPHEALSTLAIHGGAPFGGAEPYYSAADAGKLAWALDHVLGSITCTVALEHEVVDPESVTVMLDDQSWGYVDDCAKAHGWTWPDAQGPHDRIMLCGSACTALQTTGEVEVTSCE